MRRGVMALLLGLLAAAPAQASLILAGTIGGANFCAADNNIGCTWGTILLDLDPAVGVLSLGTSTIAGVEVQGSLHTQTIGTQNILNSSSLSITNKTGGPSPEPLGDRDATIVVGGTDFLGPIATAHTSGSGTWVNADGSTIEMHWYDDPTNQQGGQTPTDTPGLLLDNFLDAAGVGVDSFAHNGGPFLVNDPLLFSMTLQFHLHLTPGGSLISRGETEIKDQALTAVPEPASLILLGIGLSGLGLRARRRRA